MIFLKVEYERRIKEYYAKRAAFYRINFPQRGQRKNPGLAPARRLGGRERGDRNAESGGIDVPPVESRPPPPSQHSSAFSTAVIFLFPIDDYRLSAYLGK